MPEFSDFLPHSRLRNSLEPTRNDLVLFRIRLKSKDGCINRQEDLGIGDGTGQALLECFLCGVS